MEPLEGKVVLVTGSSRGIGKAIARKCAQAGADIVVNFRKAGGSSLKQAEELSREIEDMGRRAYMIQADISSKESVKALFSEISDRAGKLDVLVLNAAKAPFKPVEKLLERELRQLVETNYMGNIFCIQAALPMLTAAQGRIIFISSLGSRFYNPAYPLGSMKAAMESVVRDCAEGLREKNVLVNAVCGGIVRTDSFKVLRQYWDNIDKLPEELFVEPDELADVVAFLCSRASRGITGQTIVVDKGLSNAICRTAG
jgi:NAD(P)-dependent dehydrogenase (short-subunit alcohol dehydrogenase family)